MFARALGIEGILELACDRERGVEWGNREKEKRRKRKKGGWGGSGSANWQEITVGLMFCQDGV